MTAASNMRDKKNRATDRASDTLSVDHAIVFRNYVLKESASNVMMMILPSLTEYSLAEKPPQAVELDSTSLKDDVILVLDTFFQLIVWKGYTIREYLEHGFHHMEEYDNLRQMLKEPLRDAGSIIAQRFPCPKFVSIQAERPSQLALRDEEEGVPAGRGSPSFRKKSRKSHENLRKAYEYCQVRNPHDAFFMSHVFGSSMGGDVPFKVYVDNLIVAVTET